ncbi:hypothetical protein TYRP_011048 [Tyrophagus putrescentiae]|nr:hypothetical protein TYRP_011048 [Tyrophagus putrescentiae]
MTCSSHMEQNESKASRSARSGGGGALRQLYHHHINGNPSSRVSPGPDEAHRAIGQQQYKTAFPISRSASLSQSTSDKFPI